jgi:hypothetical protein
MDTSAKHQLKRPKVHLPTTPRTGTGDDIHCDYRAMLVQHATSKKFLTRSTLASSQAVKSTWNELAAGAAFHPTPAETGQADPCGRRGQALQAVSAQAAARHQKFVATSQSSAGSFAAFQAANAAASR